MKSYLSIRPLAVFVIAVAIGAFSTSIFVSEGSYRGAGDVAFNTPELYNSAESPGGEDGGKIIPASCSIGQLSDAADGFVPCTNPTVTMCVDGSCGTSARSTNVAGGQSKNWTYTSTNADHCDLTTTMNPTTAGPSFTIATGPVSANYTPGPFGNVNGWVRYTVTCYNVNRSQSGSNNITINTSIAPKVDVLFGGGTSPFIGITSFTGPTETFGQSAILRWEVTGASNCTATGPAGWSGSPISRPTGSQMVYYSGSFAVVRYYTLTCTDSEGSAVSQTHGIFWDREEVCGGSTGIICR